MPKYAKNWEIPGGNPSMPTHHGETQADNHAGKQIGEEVGNYTGTIGTPSIQTSEEPQSLPGN